MTPEDIERRRDARRNNEGVKLLATLLNNLAIGTFIAGVLTPSIAGRPLPVLGDAALVFVAVCLHIGAQIALRRLLKSED